MDANQESLEDLERRTSPSTGAACRRSRTRFSGTSATSRTSSPEGELDRRFNLFAAPTTATVATRGVGVFESLEKITRLVVEAYKAQMPHGESTGIAALDADDLGIEEAVRELAESDRAGPKSAPMSSRGPRQETRTSSQTKLAPALANQAATVSPVPIKASSPPTSSSQLPVTAEPPPSAPEGALTFAPMWPEEERHAVRRAENYLAAGDWQNAVLSCDLLVARVLASGASLAGTLEAPRDPAVVALLLGLAGPRYLAFRSTVRSARRKEPVSPEAAFSAFLFAIEARRARLDVE